MNGTRMKLGKDFVLKLILVTSLLLGLFSSIALAQETSTYYIRLGDTLAQVAADHEITLEELLALNPTITNPNNIFVGTAIQVPIAVELEAGTVVAQCPNPYTVQAGDTWATIATSHSVNAGVLALVNNMSVTDSLEIGGSLCIPATTVAAEPAPIVMEEVEEVVEVVEVVEESGMDTDDTMTPPPSPPTSLPLPGQGNGNYHRVQRGEYLSLIARRYNCTARTLAAVNSIPNPSLVYVNTLLWVPDDCASLQHLLPAIQAPVFVPRAPAPRPQAPTPAPAPAPRAPVPSAPAASQPSAPVPPSQQPGAPVPAPQPQVPAAAPSGTPFNYTSHGPWTGRYFSNPDVQGGPAVTRQDSQIVFDWGPNSPAAGLPTDGFSVQWVGNFYFTGGEYRFIALADDGIRVWVDDALIINGWKDQSKTMYYKDYDLRYGNHTVRVEYYDSRLDAVAIVNWAHK